MSLPDWLFAGVILDDETPPRTILIASDTAEIVFEGEPSEVLAVHWFWSVHGWAEA